ncbi:MAG: hypothetical protein C0404_14985 [Verrucomicrobia bacterium]|nr:hypothetical protein [Verrucomicrobiota bacterium]
MSGKKIEPDMDFDEFPSIVPGPWFWSFAEKAIKARHAGEKHDGFRNLRKDTAESCEVLRSQKDLN